VIGRINTFAATSAMEFGRLWRPFTPFSRVTCALCAIGKLDLLRIRKKAAMASISWDLL